MADQSNNLPIGQDQQKIKYNPPTELKDILGSFEVVSAVPTNVPGNKLLEKNKIYINGTDYRLYTYASGDWYYVDLTKV